MAGGFLFQSSAMLNIIINFNLNCSCSSSIYCWACIHHCDLSRSERMPKKMMKINQPLTPNFIPLLVYSHSNHCIRKNHFHSRFFSPSHNRFTWNSAGAFGWSVNLKCYRGSAAGRSDSAPRPVSKLDCTYWKGRPSCARASLSTPV